MSIKKMITLNILFSPGKPNNTHSSRKSKFEMFNSLYIFTPFEPVLQVSINNCWALFHEIQCIQWWVNIARKPKFRTYVTFKDTNEVKRYVLSFMNRKHRSYLAQYRCGILPLEIETGRWQNKTMEKRICKVCESGKVENELHFIFSLLYTIISEQHFYKI